MADVIAAHDLQRMLLDVDVADEEIARYLTVDPVGSRPFQPDVVVAPEKVDNEEEGAVLLGSLNGLARWRRQRRYRRRIDDGWRGPRVVSEGDSWFQYPFLLKDTIDQLWEDYAILSFGAAGDVLANMVEQDEVTEAIEAEQAKVFLMSAGGNDMLGEGALRSYLRAFEANRPPEEYLNEDFEPFLERVLTLFDQFFTRLTRRFGDLTIFCHGYGNAIPTDGRWLGKPMKHESIGLHDPALQREIVRVIVTRMNDALAGLADRLGPRVVYVDCRDAVPDDQWHDELHPTDAGYARVADRFRARLP